VSASDEETEAPTPRELVVDAKPAPADQSDSSGTAMLPFLGPAVVAGALAKYVSPTMGLLGLGVGVLVVLVLRRPDEGRFVLRVCGEEVVIFREKKPGEPVARLALGDLTDITLDKQTTPGGGRAGGAKERVRLALERRAPQDPVFVPEDHVTPFEGQEWLAKVRVFLRKHGWVPDDER
jgi:hypothetical protein